MYVFQCVYLDSSPLWLRHSWCFYFQSLLEDNHPPMTSASSSNATTSSPPASLTEVLSAWLLSTLLPKSRGQFRVNTDELSYLQESYLHPVGNYSVTSRVVSKNKIWDWGSTILPVFQIEQKERRDSQASVTSFVLSLKIEGYQEPQTFRALVQLTYGSPCTQGAHVPHKWQ